jgi:hypothetical protein
VSRHRKHTPPAGQRTVARAGLADTAPSGMAERALWIAWPAFIAACVLELLVFAVIDPSELQWSGAALGWSRQGAYTFAFFVFWIVSMGACALTTLLRMSPAAINRCPFTPGDRPQGCPGR